MTFDEMEARFGFSRAGLARHKRNHFSKGMALDALKAAREERDTADAAEAEAIEIHGEGTVRAQLEELDLAVKRIQKLASNPSQVLEAVKLRKALLELKAKL